MKADKDSPIDLRFRIEPSINLWNMIFEGHEENVFLICEFNGTGNTATILHKFGNILKGKHLECQVALTGSGLVIRKPVSTGNLPFIEQWTKLMYELREEILKLIDTNTGNKNKRKVYRDSVHNKLF